VDCNYIKARKKEKRSTRRKKHDIYLLQRWKKLIDPLLEHARV
jgi:hypothetical protein